MEAKPALAHRWDGWGGIGGTAKWQSDIQHHQAPPSLGGFGMDIYTYSQGGGVYKSSFGSSFCGFVKGRTPHQTPTRTEEGTPMKTASWHGPTLFIQPSNDHHVIMAFPFQTPSKRGHGDHAPPQNRQHSANPFRTDLSELLWKMGQEEQELSDESMSVSFYGKLKDEASQRLLPRPSRGFRVCLTRLALRCWRRCRAFARRDPCSTGEMHSKTLGISYTGL